jgi:hypothetical protein
MHRKGEYARVGFEDECRAVAMVHIEIDDCHALCDSARLQRANGDSDVVKQAEALAVISERMMETATQVTDHRPSLHGVEGGGDGSANHRAKTFDGCA